MDKIIKIKIPENYEVANISNQGFKKDGWTIIEIYKCREHYYALIECERCGYQQLVGYYGFITKGRKTKPCKNCKNYAEIGNIYGCTEILELDHVEYYQGREVPYYKVRCTKCGKQSIKPFRKNDWLKRNSCTKCTAAFESSFLNRMIICYKYGAKDRNLCWDLTNDEFLKLISSNCFYCGEAPKHRNIYTRYNTPIEGICNGIDRIDSNLGYTTDNCVPCCPMCNFMKQEFHINDFLSKIEQIHNHLKQGSTTIENTSENGSE